MSCGFNVTQTPAAASPQQQLALSSSSFIKETRKSKLICVVYEYVLYCNICSAFSPTRSCLYSMNISSSPSPRVCYLNPHLTTDIHLRHAHANTRMQTHTHDRIHTQMHPAPSHSPRHGGTVPRLPQAPQPSQRLHPQSQVMCACVAPQL